MSSFADEVRELTCGCTRKHYKSCDRHVAAITAAHERGMEVFANRLKHRLFGLLSRPEDGGLYLDDAWDAIDAEQRARIKGEEDNK